MLATRCRIARKETMADKTDHKLEIANDDFTLTVASACSDGTWKRLVVAIVAALGAAPTTRPASPRELHPDACPHCELAAGHTHDCPTVTGPDIAAAERDYRVLEANTREVNP